MFHAAWKNKDTGIIEDIDYEKKVHENCKLIVLKVTKVSD